MQVERPHLDHPAFLYTGIEDFVSVMAPYVTQGLEGDEVVFIAARGDYLEPLRSAVGARADEVIWADTFAWHPHPSRRLHAFHEFVTARLDQSSKRIRLAGEPVWPDGPPELVLEWQRYESVLNEVLSPYPVSLLCLYDASGLGPELLEGAETTHRSVVGPSGSRPSGMYEEPASLLRRWSFRLAAPPAGVLPFEVTDAASGRRFLEAKAVEAGLGGETTMELCLAANEILTNAFVHAPGATLHTWLDEGRFICQIDDEGDGIPDPFVGYRPPSEHGEGGRGIWIARQLVDLLQISSDASGTSVRLHIFL